MANIDIESNLISEDPATGFALDDLYKGYDSSTEANAEATKETPAAVQTETPVKSVEDAVPVTEPDAEEPSLEDVIPVKPPVSRVPETAEEVDPLKAFDEVKLRPDASQKTKDSFAKLKEISTAALRAANAEKVKLRQDHEAAFAEFKKTPASTELAPDIKKELEELRGFKATFDIENDPAFKKEIEAKMEVPKASNYDAIYGILQGHGLPESEVKALRELVESDRVSSIGDLIEKLPRLSRMKIEAKLHDNLNLDDARGKAISEARASAAAKKAEFREAPEKTREKEVADVKEESNKFRTHAVFKKFDITSTTPSEEKKRFETENVRIDSLAKLYEEAVNDPTPAGRAENAFGVVLAHHFKAQADANAVKITKLETEMAAIKKRGGMGNLGKVVNLESTKSSRPADSYDADVGSSLDELAREAGVST